MVPLRATLAETMAKLLRPQPLTPGKLDLAWRLSVGSALARVTGLRLREDGVLVIHATDPRWRPELETAVPLIRRRLAAFLGEELVAHLEIQ